MPDRLATERIEWYGRLGLAAAESARIPCGLIFNECPIDSHVLAAMECGFNIVSMADPSAEPAQYAQRVAAIVAAAHAKGIAVEAEVGELPCGATGSEQTGQATDARQAAEFVRATGVDMLAVSVGNEHIRTSGSRSLDLDAWPRFIETSIARWCCTVARESRPTRSWPPSNWASRRSITARTSEQRYLQTLRRALETTCDNPHRLLGMGGPEDVMVAGRLAVRDAVLERLPDLGSMQKA